MDSYTHLDEPIHSATSWGAEREIQDYTRPDSSIESVRPSGSATSVVRPKTRTSLGSGASSSSTTSATRSRWGLTSFLSSLATRSRVSAATQNQALAALLFLYREVLELGLPWLDEIVRAKQPQRLPVPLRSRRM